MGFGSSKPKLSPDEIEKLAQIGHSTGELCGKLTYREWNNLTFETKRFIGELDEARQAGKIEFDSITINEPDGLNGNYVGERDKNGKAHGEGTFKEHKSSEEYKGTF